MIAAASGRRAGAARQHQQLRERDDARLIRTAASRSRSTLKYAKRSATATTNAPTSTGAGDDERAFDEGDPGVSQRARSQRRGGSAARSRGAELLEERGIGVTLARRGEPAAPAPATRSSAACAASGRRRARRASGPAPVTSARNAPSSRSSRACGERGEVVRRQRCEVARRRAIARERLEAAAPLVEAARPPRASKCARRRRRSSPSLRRPGARAGRRSRSGARAARARCRRRARAAGLR